MASNISFRGAARRVHMLALLPALLLAACGGGGSGGGDGGGEAPDLASAVVITEANAKPVAADAVANVTSPAAGQLATDLVIGVQVDADAKGTGVASLAGITRTLVGMLPATQPRATGVEIDETAQCQFGGSIGISGSIADPTGEVLRAGDTIAINANACELDVDGIVSTLDGRLSMRVISGSADSFPFHIVLATTARQLRVSGGGLVVTSDGDMEMDWTATSPSLQNMVITGARLMNASSSNGRVRSSAWTNYRQQITMDGSIVSTRLDADVEISNRRVSNTPVSYALSTPSPVVVNSSTGDVIGGSIKVEGRDSALLLTVTAVNTLRLRVDADGDGSYETSMPMTLAELDDLQ